MSTIRNTYESLLKAGKAAIEAAQIPFKVRAEKKKLELQIIQQESKISGLELDFEKLKGEHPLNYDKIVAAWDELELAERKLKLLVKLQEELFD